MPRPGPNRSSALAAAASLASLGALLGTLYYLDISALLSQRVQARKVEKRAFDASTAPSLSELKLLCDQITLHSTYPLAQRIERNIPIYDCRDFDLADLKRIDRLQDELYHNLTSGPGVYVLKRFFPDTEVIDTANEAFDSIIATEKAVNGSKGDHFAPTSANDRIWNSFSKHALADPESFVEYFSNPVSLSRPPDRS